VNSSSGEFYVAENVCLWSGSGSGSGKNLQLAIKWYTKSAEQGSDVSQTNLEALYHLDVSI